MRQFVWLLALIAIGAITAAAQLDRQSRYSPPVAALVPQPARSFAQYHLASQALEAGDAKAALSEARLLVARRPMPAENLRILAQAHLVAGETQSGTIIAQRAAQRGWRDFPSQQAMLALALSAGDDPQTVRRYIAIWVTQGENPTLQNYAPVVFQSEPALAEAERLLLEKSRWRDGFLRYGLSDLPYETALEILHRMVAANSAPECQAMEQTLVTLRAKQGLGDIDLTADLTKLGC